MKKFGRYQLVRRIAAGGMAEVFLATGPNPVGAELLAVKLIHSHIAQDQSFIAMFLDEARLTAPLSHPNLVRIFDLGQEERRLYLAMEFIRGYPLHIVSQKAEARGQGIGAVRAAAIVEQAALGLHHAHDALDPRGQMLNLVHRDVSPHNLMLDQDGLVKVVDFGVAKAKGQLATSQKGGLKGKAGYSAPEQLRSEPLDRRADVYALGSVLFELAVGKPLFPGQSEAEILQKMLFEPLPDLRAVPDLPPALARIIGQAVAEKPRDRFSSALEFADALAGYLQASGTGKPQLAQMMGQLFAPLPLTAAEALATDALAAIRPPSGPGHFAREKPPPPLPDDLDELDPPTLSGGSPLEEATAVTSPERSSVYKAEAAELLEPTTPQRKLPAMMGGRTDQNVRRPAADLGEDTSTNTDGNDNSTRTETKPSPPPRSPRARSGLLVLGAGLGVATLVGLGTYGVLKETPVSKPFPPSSLATEETTIDAGPALVAVRPPPPIEAQPSAPPDSGANKIDPPPPPPPPLPEIQISAPREPRSRGTGTLTVITMPWTKIRLDGHDVGATPLWDRVVTAGRHRLELTNPDEKLRKVMTVDVAVHEKKVEKLRLTP